MGKTVKGSKGPGYEYWKSRLGGWELPGRSTKNLTHKKERRLAKASIRREDYEEAKLL